MYRDLILGALIGLANAAMEHEDLLTTDILLLVRHALLASPQNDTETNALIARIHDAKFTLVPSCKTCTHPCGKNSDYDLALLAYETPAAQELKWQLRRRIVQLAADDPSPAATAYLYKALRTMGEYHRDENLRKIVEEVL